MIIIFLTACAGSRKVEFNQDIRNKLEVKNINLSQVQYYLNGNIILAREISSDTAKIVKGEVVFQNGKYYETITVKHNTPGVCIAAYPNRLSISFDDNNRNLFPFILSNDNTYQILNNDIYSNNVSVIVYNGIQYILNYPGKIPSLLIKKSVINKSNSNDKILKGRRISN